MMRIIINKILNVIKLPFVRKYRFYTSLVFFLIIASVYLILIPTRYKVSSKISLNNNSRLSLQSVVSGLKAKPLVQKAIDQLPFGVNYYKESSPREEVYGNSLPVKMLLDDSIGVRYAHNLLLKPISSHSFSIEHEDTIQFYEIGEHVNQYYGKFKMVRGSAFNAHFSPLIIKLNQPSDLFKTFYENLELKTVEKDRAIVLSILVKNAEKGKDFLGKLLELYNNNNRISTQDGTLNNSLQSIQQEIATLKIKAEKLEQQSSGSGGSSVITKNVHLNGLQLKTLEVIKPYLKNSVSQFVQIPYVDEVQNIDLRNNLNKFNKAELDKQRLLGAQKIDDLAVSYVDHQLSTLQTSILVQLDRLRNGNVVETNAPDASSSNIPATELALVNRQIKADMLRYENLSQGSQEAKAVSHTGVFRVVERPGDHIQEVRPDFFIVYTLALFLGLLVPMLFTFFESLNTSITRRRWFNNQTLTEKIKILLGTRQID
jgi:tyrosine-protein kinase Etk/Wzc